MASRQPFAGHYHVATIGCQMNRADSRRLSAELERLGYEAADEAADADLVVVNTCVVRQQAENKIEGWLGSLKPLTRRRPRPIIALMGCMVGIDGDALPALRRRFPFVDVFMPPGDAAPLLEHLAVAGPGGDEARLDEARQRLEQGSGCLPAASRGRQVTANVPAVLGCSHGCSYCIIPSRRGRERSRTPDAILAEVRELVAEGIREVTLLGQIVDRYGMDLPERHSLAALLRQVAEVPGLLRVRFLTSHPRWMSDELVDAVAEVESVCPHVEIPVQAGSDAVLKAMRRGYTVAAYRDLVGRLRRRLPEVGISTDIIVGFPGETDSQFRETYDLLAELRVDKVHLARYSPRPGTVAAERLTDDVPEAEKRRRHHLLEELQRGILEEKNRAWVGRRVQVLVEGRNRDRWWGRTPQNRLVFFPDERQLLGQIVAVDIEASGPYSLVAGRPQPVLCAVS